MNTILDYLLHFNNHLSQIVDSFGYWTYVIVFLVIFIETGIIIMPFLPGESLVFASAAIAARVDHPLNIFILFFGFFIASFLGDTSNFTIGKKLGNSLLNIKLVKKIVKPEYLDKTSEFFEKNGLKAIMLARFIPIVRTMMPFISSISNVSYKQFIIYDLIGSFIWSLVGTSAGYVFGNIPFVQKHFELIIIGIIFLSLMPVIVAFIKNKLKRN